MFSFKGELRAILSGFIFVNILILSTDLFNPLNLFLSTMATSIIVLIRPWKQGHQFLATVVLCISTLVHATTNRDLGNVIWKIVMLSNVDFVLDEVVNANGFSLWKDNDKSIESGAAILTRQTQWFIHHHQSHLCDQENTTVYLVKGYSHGMGSELHFHANIMALAMEDGALFAWGEGACRKYSPHCRTLYENEHNCTPQQISKMKTQIFSDWSHIRFPSRFAAQLPSTFTTAQKEYWWRSQAIGYLMRFNGNTQQKLKSMRSELHGPEISLHGAINVNIRSGDKSLESRLSPTESFIDKALKLIESQPLAYTRTIYITSDNLIEILKAKAYANSKKLHVIYSEVPRMKNGHDANQVEHFWNYNITLSVLMQLAITSECDAWIGTRSSNWNRIIDMRRCVVGKKCQHIFVEGGDTVPGHYDYRPFGFL